MRQLLLVDRCAYTRATDLLLPKEFLSSKTMQTMSPEDQPETLPEINPICCTTGDTQDLSQRADSCERNQPTSIEPHSPEAKRADPKRTMGAVTFDESTKEEPASDEGNSATSEQEKSPGCASGKTRPFKRRKSVQQLITGFDTLRECLGVHPPDRHLSRIDTLRMAMAHISDLQNILQEAAWAAAAEESASGLGAFQLGSAGAASCPQLFFDSSDLASHPSASSCRHHLSPFCTSELGMDFGAAGSFLHAAGMGGLNSGFGTGITQAVAIPPGDLRAGCSAEALLDVALSASPASSGSLANVASPNSLLGLHNLLLGGSPNFPSLDGLRATSLTAPNLQPSLDTVSPPAQNLLGSTLPTMTSAGSLRHSSGALPAPQQLAFQVSTALAVSAGASTATVSVSVPSSTAGD